MDVDDRGPGAADGEGKDGAATRDGVNRHGSPSPGCSEVGRELLEELTLALGPHDTGHRLPSLKRMRVGMLMTSNRRVMSRLSSMLSLATSSFPACSEAISSSTGAIILHGPHHSAQKSTSTGTSEDLTCSSKLASLRV